ncbi:MAG: nuclear transport factor 2 family protein [Chthoniobacterales bacterium]
MKTSVVAFALIALVLPAAIAQEVSSSPPAEETVPDKADKSRSDPSVSITTEKTTSPTPKPKPKAEPSASPTKASSPGPSKTSPSPSPSAASAAVSPVKKSTPEATIREMENQWEASVMRHDSSVAQAYLAEDFHGVSSTGKLMSKANLLAELKKDTEAYSSTKTGKVDVRVFNGQFAVATGTSIEAGKSKDGKDFKRTFRWTDVWALRQDKWQCVASQAMLVP